MYEARFGLTHNPFRIQASGPLVFVGPRQSSQIASLHKTLSGTANVVTVSGPAGVGKTALVTRALETNKAHQMVAWIGRMRLAPDDVLTLLLSGFGLSKIPAGSVQKFAIFKQILNKRAQQGIRVVVVVEDALRLSNEALLELEAVTAAEAGNCGGAHLVLMGPSEIEKRLTLPELARLRQRSRNGQRVEALTYPETRAYLAHGLRTAGAAIDACMDNDAVAMLFRCSAGIPRVINNLCHSAFSAADEAGIASIDEALVAKIAADEYGLEPSLPAPDPITASPALPDEMTHSKTEPVANGAEMFDPGTADNSHPAPPSVAAGLADEHAEGVDPDIEVAMPVLDETDKIPVLSDAMRVDIEAGTCNADAEISDDEIGDNDLPVINEELPDLSAALAKLDLDETAPFQALPSTTVETTRDDQESSSSEIPDNAAVAPETAADSLDQESTHSQEISGVDERPSPDLAALEAAIAAARRGEFKQDEIPESDATPESDQAVAHDSEPEPQPEPESESEYEPDALAVLEADEEPATTALPEQEFKLSDFEEPSPEPRGEDAEDYPSVNGSLPQLNIDEALEDQRTDAEQLDAMAANLAGANSLQDMSAKMAETLFGDEFEALSEDALTEPDTTGITPVAEDHVGDVVASHAPAEALLEGSSANDSINEESPLAALDAIRLELPDPEPIFDTDHETADEVKEAVSDPDSSEQLGAASIPHSEITEEVVLQSEPIPSAVAVAPIERQFETGMTQTLATLNTKAKDAESDKKSSGLFGKLKNSLRR